MADEAKKNYITPEMKKDLEARLKALRDHQPVLAKLINDCREEGDLSENAGYHAALDQQAEEVRKIHELEARLENSSTEIGVAEEGIAAEGAVLHVYYNGDESDTETFLIGDRATAPDDPNLEVYSTSSPIGAAVLGARDGDTRTYKAPNGSEISVTIVSAAPYTSDK